MANRYSKHMLILLLPIFLILPWYTCAQAGEKSSLQSISYKYFGNSDSNKFHRPSCIYASAISKRHLVLFQWRWQAIAAHFQPCRYCLPPVVKSTHAVLLTTH
jgi:hypothetical protein